MPRWWRGMGELDWFPPFIDVQDKNLSIEATSSELRGTAQGGCCWHGNVTPCRRLSKEGGGVSTSCVRLPRRCTPRDLLRSRLSMAPNRGRIGGDRTATTALGT